MRIYYFGCWDRIGHFLWTPSGASMPLSTTPWGNAVDSGLCPGRRDRHGEVACEDQREGWAALHHLDGWTALAFWDRSVDKRHGSNSVFVAEGTLTADQMLESGAKAYPHVRVRFRFPIVVEP